MRDVNMCFGQSGIGSRLDRYGEHTVTSEQCISITIMFINIDG